MVAIGDEFSKQKFAIFAIFRRFWAILAIFGDKYFFFFGRFFLKGKSDLGRDLICTKGRQVLIIQAKNWSKHSTIHEKHMMQLAGTMLYYIFNDGKNRLNYLLGMNSFIVSNHTL